MFVQQIHREGLLRGASPGDGVSCSEGSTPTFQKHGLCSAGTGAPRLDLASVFRRKRMVPEVTVGVPLLFWVPFCFPSLPSAHPTPDAASLLLSSLVANPRAMDIWKQ